MINTWKEFFFSRPIVAWNQFWFSPRDEDLRSIALFRFVFCATMFFFYLSRVPDIGFFYGEEGVMPSSYLKAVELFRYHPTIFDGVKNVSVLYGFHSLFLLSLLCLALGLFSRIMAPVTYFLHMMFLNRNQSVMFGVDMIGTFFFFYLMFANSSAYYSLDSRLFKNVRWLFSRKASLLSHVALRLMQIQLCVVYAYSGLEKLKGTRWWDGSAIWDVLSMGNMQRWDLSFVAHMPVFLALNAYIVLFWEIYFPVLVWKKELRNYVLLFGVLMHIGIGLFMNLPSFAAMMISIYVLFLPGEEVDRFLRRQK